MKMEHSALERGDLSPEKAEAIFTEFLIRVSDRIVIDLDSGACGLEKLDDGWHYAQMIWLDDVFEHAIFPEESEAFKSLARFLKDGERFGLSDEEALGLLRLKLAWFGIAAYGRVSGRNVVYEYIRED